MTRHWENANGIESSRLSEQYRFWIQATGAEMYTKSDLRLERHFAKLTWDAWLGRGRFGRLLFVASFQWLRRLRQMRKPIFSC